MAHLGSGGKVKDRDRPRAAQGFVRLGAQKARRDPGVGDRGVVTTGGSAKSQMKLAETTH